MFLFGPWLCQDFPQFLCQEGHTVQSCKVKKAQLQPESLSRDDMLFWSFVQPEARPVSLLVLSEYESESEDDDEDEEDEMEIESDDEVESEEEGDM